VGENSFSFTNKGILVGTSVVYEVYDIPRQEKMASVSSWTCCAGTVWHSL